MPLQPAKRYRLFVLPDYSDLADLSGNASRIRDPLQDEPDSIVGVRDPTAGLQPFSVAPVKDKSQRRRLSRCQAKVNVPHLVSLVTPLGCWNRDVHNDALTLRVFLRHSRSVMRNGRPSGIVSAAAFCLLNCFGCGVERIADASVGFTPK